MEANTIFALVFPGRLKRLSPRCFPLLPQVHTLARILRMTCEVVCPSVLLLGEVAHKRYLSDWFTGGFPGSSSRDELYNDDPHLGDARLYGTTASLCGMETASEQRDAIKAVPGPATAGPRCVRMPRLGTSPGAE